MCSFYISVINILKSCLLKPTSGDTLGTVVTVIFCYISFFYNLIIYCCKLGLYFREGDREREHK